MPATITEVFYSIYTLVLIGTVVLLLKHDDSIHQKNKIVKVRYFKTDKFSSNIVRNKSTLQTFWLIEEIIPIVYEETGASIGNSFEQGLLEVKRRANGVILI